MKLIALRTKYPDAWRRVRRSYYCWLAGSFSLIILFVLLTALPYTRIFSLYNSSHILPTTVLCNTKRLRIALEQYAVQQLIQNGNYRLELKQVSRFKITSNIVFTSFLLLTVSLIIDELLFAITTLLYFGKCYFPLIYGTAFEPILTTTNQQIILFQVNYYISRVNIILYLVSFLVVSIPLSIATLINVYRLFHNRFIRTIRIRYNYEYLEALIRER